ncbi:MAG: hypothetical protein EAZ77_15325 [Nostocales cyanobacterium]|nr:MAG: hypothetical protein EAZ77_15325 [Nostocales cyanobacterium]
MNYFPSVLRKATAKIKLDFWLILIVMQFRLDFIITRTYAKEGKIKVLGAQGCNRNQKNPYTQP